MVVMAVILLLLLAVPLCYGKCIRESLKHECIIIILWQPLGRQLGNDNYSLIQVRVMHAFMRHALEPMAGTLKLS